MTPERAFGLLQDITHRLRLERNSLAEVRASESASRARGYDMYREENATTQRHMAELESAQYTMERHRVEARIANLEEHRDLLRFAVKYDSLEAIDEAALVLGV